MIKRLVFGAVGLAVAGVGPAAYFSAPGYWQSVRNEWYPAEEAAAAEQTLGSLADDATARPESSMAQRPPVSSAAPPSYGLAEVLNFDVTMDWVLKRWPRVSTGLAHLQYQGYRVPLVTGTAESDLAGSLTYYFNSQQVVEQITLRGTTGDARKLVALLSTRHGFARRVANDPGLFIYEVAHSAGRPKSVLEIRSAGVVQSSDPYGRFKVDLVMQRP